MNIKVIRVSSNLMRDILTYQGKIILRSNKNILLLCDTKETLVVKLDKDGNIISRSFLTFQDSLDVCEFSYNLSVCHIDFVKSSRMVVYPKCELLEVEARKYFKSILKKDKNEDFSKYLYYQFYDSIDGYTKDKLLSTLESANIEKTLKLYNFLIEN